MTAERIPGPRSERIVAQERQHMAAGLQSFALHAGRAMARGTGSTLIDEDGNTYIDFIAGIAVGSVGHCHPHYVEALKRQVERLTFGSFSTEVRARFLELLGSVTPAGLTRIQLFSGGAEAVEAALRLAKAATKKTEVLGFWGGFHGKTGGVLGLLGSDFKHHLGPFLPGQYLSPYADCYRCPLKLTYPECGIACADFLRDVIRYQTGGEIGAIIVEPIQGTAGNVVPPPGYLRVLRRLADELGALLIADEMLTGFGRTGRMFAIEHDGIVPDIMTVGKGFGGGFPMSGVIAREDVAFAKPWANPSGSSSSYGGNPFAAAAAHLAIQTILEEGLVENSRRVGEKMLAEMKSWEGEIPIVSDVRGKGLMIGMELVKDPQTRAAAKELCDALITRAYHHGLLLLSCGASTLRFMPPLLVDEAQVDEAIGLLEAALTEAQARA